MKKLSFLLAFTFLCSSSLFAQKDKKPKRSLGQLQMEATFARPDGKDMVFHIKGSAYAFIPGERPVKIFGVEGYNVRRRVETPEKPGFFSRRARLYFIKTGKPMRSSANGKILGQRKIARFFKSKTIR